MDGILQANSDSDTLEKNVRGDKAKFALFGITNCS